MPSIEAQDLAVGDVIDDGSLTPVLGVRRDSAGRVRLTLPGRLRAVHPRSLFHVLATPPGRYVRAEELQRGDSLGHWIGFVMAVQLAGEGEIRVDTTHLGLICRKHQPVRVGRPRAAQKQTSEWPWPLGCGGRWR